MKSKVLVIGALVLLLLAGCDDAGVTTNQPSVTHTRGVYIGGNIHRYIDDEAGVVCWLWEDSLHARGGIDGELVCMPIGETSLRVGE